MDTISGLKTDQHTLYVVFIALGCQSVGKAQKLWAGAKKKLIFICAARISFIRLTIMLRDNIDVFLIFRDTAFERINNSVQGGRQAESESIKDAIQRP